MSISLSKANDVEDKNGSWAKEANGSIWFWLIFPLGLVWSMLSSSTISNAGRESSVGNWSNAGKIEFVVGRRRWFGLFNDDDNDDGSCLMIFVVATAIADVDFGGELTWIPFDRHFFSNS